MDHVDTLLTRMAAVPAPQSLRDDPGFVARLDASAARGDLLRTARSVTIGVAVAGLMVATYPGPATPGGDGLLLTTPGGQVL